MSLIGPIEVMKEMQDTVFTHEADKEKYFEVAVGNTAEELAIFYIFNNVPELDSFLDKRPEASEFYELLSSQFKKFRDQSGLFVILYEDPDSENYVLSLSDDKKIMVEILSQLLTS
jgi:hypothetical protein